MQGNEELKKYDESINYINFYKQIYHIRIVEEINSDKFT